MVMAAIVALRLLSYKLESGEGAILYSFQRVFRQMGYDEGVVTVMGDNESRL